MIEGLRSVLAADPRIAYALLFGSHGRGAPRAGSDVDVAVGLAAGARMSARDAGELVSRLEAATGTRVDVAERRARAILEHPDWKPIEECEAVTGGGSAPQG